MNIRLSLKGLRALLLLPLLLTGCAFWAAPYDPVTDEAIQNLASKTELTLTKVTLHKEPYSQHAEFYVEAEAAVRSIELRSQLYRENEAEIALLNKLSSSYQLLKTSHDETGGFGRGAAEGTRSILRSLLHHQLSKKSSSALIEKSSSTES